MGLFRTSIGIPYIYSSNSKYSGLFGKRTFPDNQKLSQNQKKMEIILKYIFLGLIVTSKFAIWLTEIQNCAFRLDGRVWLSATIIQKSPLYFGMEGVIIRNIQQPYKTVLGWRPLKVSAASISFGPNRKKKIYLCFHTFINWIQSQRKRKHENEGNRSSRKCKNFVRKNF